MNTPKTPLMKFLIPLVLIPLLGICQEEYRTSDTLTLIPYHITNPETHLDTLYLQGYPVKHLVDSTGVAVFLYDPNQGFWMFNPSLSTGIIED